MLGENIGASWKVFKDSMRLSSEKSELLSRLNASVSLRDIRRGHAAETFSFLTCLRLTFFLACHRS